MDKDSLKEKKIAPRGDVDGTVVTTVTTKRTFTPGTVTSFTKPEGVNSIEFHVRGGRGGNGSGDDAKGGKSVDIKGTILTLQGTAKYDIYVGSAGLFGGDPGVGFGNGGAGGLSFADGKASGGGGGASAIVEVATGYPLIQCAGGGGGSESKRGGHATFEPLVKGDRGQRRSFADPNWYRGGNGGSGADGVIGGGGGGGGWCGGSGGLGSSGVLTTGYLATALSPKCVHGECGRAGTHYRELCVTIDSCEVAAENSVDGTVVLAYEHPVHPDFLADLASEGSPSIPLDGYIPSGPSGPSASRVNSSNGSRFSRIFGKSRLK